jgi:hypothetical protein
MTQTFSCCVRAYRLGGVDIARTLELIAEVYEAELAAADGRGAVALLTRQALTAFVWLKAGRPLDRHVAALTAAVLGWHSYTYEDQQKFRKKYVRPPDRNQPVPKLGN